METRTILDRIEIDPKTGSVSVKLVREIVNGEHRIAAEPHRFTLDAMEDALHLDVLQTSVLPGVNNHLVDMGFPPVGGDDAEKISVFVRAAVVSDYVPTVPPLSRMAATPQSAEAKAD